MQKLTKRKKLKVGKNLLISMAVFDILVAASFAVEGKYAWTVIFICATISNIASLWLLGD